MDDALQDDDLGARLLILIALGNPWVAVLGVVESTSLVLDVVVVAQLALHDAVDGTRLVILVIILHAVVKSTLVTLVVTLVDIAAHIASALLAPRLT